MVRIKLNIHIQKTEFRPLSLNLYKNQLKWIKGIYIRPETLKLLEEKKRNHFKIKAQAAISWIGF
jgi:hypothetical protein